MTHRLALAALALLLPPFLAEAAGAAVPLPPPRTQGTVSVEATLAARRSIRSFAPRALTLAELSQLLWAAQGISGPDGKRTAPSARHTYPLELAVVAQDVEGLARGAWRYVPARHELVPLAPAKGSAPMLAAATTQKHVHAAPAVIVVAAVYERIGDGEGSATGVDFEAGAAGENLMLQAVALGLGTCVVGGFDPAKAKAAVGFTGQEKAIVLIPVGG